MTSLRLGSHYLLHEQIGQGGMGVVWRAEDTEAETGRAIKVLRPEYAQDPAAVARFVRERNALLALSHPNVVTLHDMIVEGERLALVMDLLTEGDLDKCRRDHGGTLPPELAAELTAQICDGLAAAHAAGIVHRDLKPANVLMDQGRARLTDFGIARIAGEPSLTTVGTVIGTVCYMAPEVLSGAVPSPACDVYAVGVTLYELLAGRPPFTGQVGTVIYDHLQTAPPRPDGFPGPLWALTAACLGKDPATRPTAAQLAAALRNPETPRDEPRAEPAGRPGAAAGPPRGPQTVTGSWRLASAGTAAVAHVSGWRRWRTWAVAAAAVVVVGGGGTGAIAIFGFPAAGPHPAGPASPASSAREVTRTSAAASGTASPPGSHPAVSSSPGQGETPSPGSSASSSPDSTGAPSASATSPARTSASAVPGWEIENSQSQWCLNVAGASEASGAQIDQANCSDDTAEQWHAIAGVTLSGDVYYQYQNGHSGLCLSVVGSASGALLIQQDCSDGNHSQFWRNLFDSGGEYEFVNGHSGLCMGVLGSSTAQNADLDQGTCAGTGTQTWTTLAGP